MGILDELLEKKDLLAYIDIRIQTLKIETQNNLKILPYDKKEKMLERATGRIRELESLRRIIHNNKIREQSMILFSKNISSLSHKSGDGV